MKQSMPSLLLVWAVWSVDGIVASIMSPLSGPAMIPMRGGASPSSGKKSKKSSKKKESSKEIIAEAMKEKDAAEALGDAIR